MSFCTSFVAVIALALLQVAWAADTPPMAFSYDKCTTMAVGKRATATGAPMTTHTADCAECDWRVNKVAARDWPEGSMRPIYLLTGAYPRQVREDRGVTWSKGNLEREMPQVADWDALENRTIIGYIPQVPHTFALIEGMYGIMNEHHVAIGESTCAAKLYAAPVSAGGDALLEISELSQIALERTKTARDAILLMGQLAEQYGYYSAEWNKDNPYGEGLLMGEGGEALSVVDRDEAWVFHILPDDSGKSAIWVAQRVPDDHIAAVANNFVIREVIPGHPDFLYSNNLWEVAQRKGWWSPAQGLLHFVHTYAPPRIRAEYAHRRVWRIFTWANVDMVQRLPAQTNTFADDYPFSVPVHRENGEKIAAQDLMDLQRDHYEGTPYSTGYGSLAGGPYGDPNRFDVSPTEEMTIWEALKGEFPRTISLFRTSYSIVAEPRPRSDKSNGNNGDNQDNSLFPRVWFAQYAPDQSTFLPLYVLAESLPLPWIRGTMQKYNPASAFWNFCAAGNYASRFYVHAMKTVRSVQRQLESFLTQQTNDLDQRLMGMNQEEAVRVVTQAMSQWGEEVNSQWRNLLPTLITTYRDGFIIGGQDTTYVEIKRMFYPKWWLEKVGYFNAQPVEGGDAPGAIYFAPNPETAQPMTGALSVFGWIFVWVVTSVVMGVLGFVAGQRQKRDVTVEEELMKPVSPLSSSVSRTKLTLQPRPQYSVLETQDRDEEEEGGVKAVEMMTKTMKRGTGLTTTYSYQAI